MTDDFEPVESDATEYGLVMPFVVAKSNGGPYDDTALVAGLRIGDIDAKMRIAAEFGLELPPFLPLYPQDEPQLDLIAMRHGFRMQVKPYSDDWSLYTFTREGHDGYAERSAEAVRTAALGCFSDDASIPYDGAEVVERLREWADALDGGPDDHREN